MMANNLLLLHGRTGASTVAGSVRTVYTIRIHPFVTHASFSLIFVESRGIIIMPRHNVKYDHHHI